MSLKELYPIRIMIIVCLFFHTGCSPDNSGKLVNQTEKNLIAFTKLYGYVKYFHPSDEAQNIDWDKFAIHGVKSVKKATDQEELIEILNTLFLPIAPTLRISLDEVPSEYFLKFYMRELAQDTTSLKTVAWQHLGVELYDQRPPYISRRLNADTRSFDKRFLLYQTFDADELSGHQIKLQATLKSQLVEKNNEVLLIISVDDKYYQTQVSERVNKHSSDEWATYEVQAEVPPDASNISIGLSVNGIGSFWIHEIIFKTQEDGKNWNLKDVYSPIVNGMLEISSEEWIVHDNGYFLYSIDSKCPQYAETQCLKIDSLSQLFEQHPVVGETIIKALEGGGWGEMPLALFHDGENTLPQGNSEQLKKLQQQLDNIYLENATGDNEDVRLANIVISWNIFQHFYPYFDVIDTDWEQQLKLAIQNAFKDNTAEDFYHTLSKMLASLHDGHINVSHPSVRNLGELPFLVDLVEGQIVVTHSVDENFIPGDVIQTVDGVPAKEMLDSLRHLVSGSPQYSLFRSLRQFGSGKFNSKEKINILRGSEVLNLSVLRSNYSMRNLDKQYLPVIEEIEKGIFFVDLVRISPDEIKDQLDKISDAKGVIFDLRGYPIANINFNILPHLLSEPDTSNQWLQTPQIIYPDQKKFVEYDMRGSNLRPLSPHIQGDVVFITDARAISAAESFLSFVKHYNLGKIIGQPTAGSNGNVNFVKLPGNYSFRWTGMKVVKHDGSQHHLIGIQPTVHIKKTISGVREERDEFLDKAIEVVQK